MKTVSLPLTSVARVRALGKLKMRATVLPLNQANVAVGTTGVIMRMNKHIRIKEEDTIEVDMLYKDLDSIYNTLVWAFPSYSVQQGTRGNNVLVGKGKTYGIILDYRDEVIILKT